VLLKMLQTHLLPVDLLLPLVLLLLLV